MDDEACESEGVSDDVATLVLSLLVLILVILGECVCTFGLDLDIFTSLTTHRHTALPHPAHHIRYHHHSCVLLHETKRAHLPLC